MHFVFLCSYFFLQSKDAGIKTVVNLYEQGGNQFYFITLYSLLFISAADSVY